MVAAVSLEKYIVICCKSVTSPKQLYYTLWVLVFSIIANVPRFFEFEAHTPNISRVSNIVQFNETHAYKDLDKKDQPFSLLYQTSKLGENSGWLLFMAYHEIALIIFCSLIISFCNFKVWIEVLNSSAMNKFR